MSRYELWRLQEDSFEENLLILSNKDLCQIHILKMGIFSLGGTRSVFHKVANVLFKLLFVRALGCVKHA